MIGDERPIRYARLCVGRGESEPIDKHVEIVLAAVTRWAGNAGRRMRESIWRLENPARAASAVVDLYDGRPRVKRR